MQLVTMMMMMMMMKTKTQMLLKVIKAQQQIHGTIQMRIQLYLLDLMLVQMRNKIHKPQMMMMIMMMVLSKQQTCNIKC